MTAEEEIQLVDKHVAQLMEQFDSVQIFCSHKVDDSTGDTATVRAGAGNWDARRGQIRDWMLYHDERIRIRARDDDFDEHEERD